ncbi:MAG: hypothetical protein JNM39_07285 [Bdellovibrionaceae bacterium]|nr:hypothetical protein [Pseudobdellovibrionaceae bacterium]
MKNLIRSFLLAFLFITLAFSSVFVHINIIANADSEAGNSNNGMGDLVAARDEARKLAARMKDLGKNTVVVTLHGAEFRSGAEDSKPKLSREFQVFIQTLNSLDIRVDFKVGHGRESEALVEGTSFLLRALNESLKHIDLEVMRSESTRAIFRQAFQHAQGDMEALASGTSLDSLERQFERLIGSMNDYVSQIESISPGFHSAQEYLDKMVNAQNNELFTASERFQRFLGETETFRNSALEVLYKRLQTLRSEIQTERSPAKVYEFSEKLLDYLRVSKELGGVDSKALAEGLAGSGELQPSFLFGDLFEGKPTANELRERAKLIQKILNGYRDSMQEYEVTGTSTPGIIHKMKNGKIRLLQTLGIPNGFDWSMYRKAITDKTFRITKTEMALAAVSSGATTFVIYYGLELQTAKGVLVDPLVGALIGGATKLTMDLFNRANGVFALRGKNFTVDKGFQLNQLHNYGTKFTHSLILGLATLVGAQVPRQGATFFSSEHVGEVLRASIMNSLIGVFAKAPFRTFIELKIREPEGGISNSRAVPRNISAFSSCGFDILYQSIKTSALIGFTLLPTSQVFIAMGIVGAGFQFAGHLKGGTEIPIFKKTSIKDLLSQIIMFKSIINPDYKTIAAETLRTDYEGLKRVAVKPINYVKEKLAPSVGATISCQQLLSNPRISVSY